MSLTTFSKFYYGFIINDENYRLDFDETGTELTGEIDVGSWTLTEILQKVKLAMENVGANTYTVSVDRATRLVTISSTVTFELLVSTGTHTGTSIFELLGFTGSDRTGASTYTGNLPAGEEYRPQFILQDHIGKEDFQRSVDAVVKESASGVPEVVKFGTKKFVQMNIKYATNKPMDNTVIKTNPTGVDDLRAFMQFCVRKASLEYMPNVNDSATYDKVILDRTPESSNGTDYKLMELYEKGLPDIFETGVILFRVIE